MKTQPDDLINAEYSFDGKTFDSKSAVYTKVGEKQGLTKREYFAALALQGLLSCSGLANESGVAGKSLEIADRLIEELNKETE